MADVTLKSAQYGIATRAAPGVTECGDRAVVQQRGADTLLAVIDGIGHGEKAAAAAQVAQDIIARGADLSPVELTRRCHEALRATRGAVLSVAQIDAQRGSLSWLGVGNVRGLVLHASGRPARHELLLRAGVVGIGHLPTLQTAVIPWQPLDTLIFATDGIRPQFAEALMVAGNAQALADNILAQHCCGNDDAVVLVARAM